MKKIERLALGRKSQIDWDRFGSIESLRDHSSTLDILQQIGKHKKSLSNLKISRTSWFEIHRGDLNYEFKRKGILYKSQNSIVTEGKWEVHDWERLILNIENEKKIYHSLFYDNKYLVLSDYKDILYLSKNNIHISLVEFNQHLYKEYLSPSDLNAGNILRPSGLHRDNEST
jgi:hypothetical protein